MKRNISIIIGIVVILVIIVLLQRKSAPEVAVNTQGQPAVQVVTSTGTPVSSQVIPKKTVISPAVPSKTVSKTPSYTSYADYMATITNARNKCTTAAKAQYDGAYVNLESSSFLSYYNEKTGGCYSKIVGDTRAEYATTTNAIIVFRDIYKNTILAECKNPKGAGIATQDWTCTDKTTGSSITLAAFNGIIYKYTAN